MNNERTESFLTEDNFKLYAAKYYFHDFLVEEEFENDLLIFKYIKKIITKYYNNGIINERLLLNHFICLFNIFERKPCIEMIKFKIPKEYHHIIKPFIIRLNMLNDEMNDVTMDMNIVFKLQKI